MTDGKFEKAKVLVPRRSRHNLGNHWVGSLSWGQLTPIYCKQVAPGETIHYEPHILVQTPPFASLTFAGIKVKQFSFFVPNRLLWSDFNNFIVGGSDGRSVWTPPYAFYADLAEMCFCEEMNITQDQCIHLLSTANSTSSKGWDYWFRETSAYGQLERGTYSSLITGLGINPFPRHSALLSSMTSQTGLGRNPSVNQLPISLLPMRAYQKVWWDWFRDSTLIPESLKDNYIFVDGGRKTYFEGEPITDKRADFVVPSETTDGRPRLAFECLTRHISYDKDYFTTARLSAQSGTVSLVPVGFYDADNLLNSEHGNDVTVPDVTFDTDRNDLTVPYWDVQNRNGIFPRYSSVPSEGSLAFTVQDFRFANSLQRFLERSNITGTRPLAQLLGRFGVAPSAARLDMAEYVGGTERTLTPQQVIQSAETSEKALGDRAAFGRLFYSGEKQYYTASEHGIFISLLCVVPEVEYCDGIDRMFFMMNKEDYFQPEFENLGFEGIYNFELSADIAMSLPSYKPYNTFGFVPRYSWMKWKRGVLAGDFARTDTEATSDSWHSFRRFSYDGYSMNNIDIVNPVLNPSFVEVYQNSMYNNWNRLFVDTSNDYDPFTVDVWNVNNGKLPMEGFVTPGLSTVYEENGRKIRIPYGGFRM